MSVNTATSNGTNNPEQRRALPAQTSPYQACSRANSTALHGTEYIPTENGSCPNGWTLVVFNTLAEMQAAIEEVLPGENQSSTPPGPPNILTGNNSPGQFVTQHTPISSVVDFLNRLWQGLINRNFWKGVGLLFLGVAAIGIGALIMFRGPSGGSQAIVHVMRSSGKKAKEATDE